MKLYLICYETDIFGTWASPKEAILEHFPEEIKSGKINPFNIDNKIEKMLSPCSDYPKFIILEAGKKFSMDR